jgi:hypothetical protein
VVEGARKLMTYERGDMNAINILDTVSFVASDGPLVAIMIGLNIADLDQADAFVREVAERFKAHRMISPPETAGLCVTIIGELSAGEFARRWRDLVARDEILRLFMGKMRIADVIRGTPSGQQLESVSLLQE